MQLKWNPPPEGERNGPITGYRIRYKSKGSKGVTLNVEGGVTEHQLNDLDPDTKYSVRIAAQTQASFAKDSRSSLALFVRA